MKKYQKGEINGWMIASIGLIVMFLATGSVMIWALLNYQEQKLRVDDKVALASAEAKKEQADADEKKFAEREKEPRREFASPDDLGRLSFTYPKTWSAYVDGDPTANPSHKDYKAYLNPITVPPVSVRGQQFALRVMILKMDYNKYLESKSKAIEKGELRSSTISIHGENGVRIDGTLEKDIRGSAVIFKIRDKTAVVQSDAEVFKHDFNDLIKTIRFIK